MRYPRRVKRWIALLVVALAAGALFGELVRRRVRNPIRLQDLAPAMEVEAARAREIGITQELARGEERLRQGGRRSWSRPVALEQGQCLAAIVGVTGERSNDTLRGLQIRDHTGTMVHAESVELHEVEPRHRLLLPLRHAGPVVRPGGRAAPGDGGCEELDPDRLPGGAPELPAC